MRRVQGFLILLIVSGCATTGSRPPQSTPPVPISAPAKTSEATPKVLSPDVAKLSFADHIVLGTPVPDGPGVFAVREGEYALVTWETKIPAVDMRLGGDFEAWRPDQTLPMIQAKNRNGKEVWYITLRLKLDTILTYKYYVNGGWKEDAMAPSTMDDGFGGHKGKVDVKALLAASK